jgi:MoaA/NifB/PqqE/SkfB family radical SAM enzyme
MINQIENIQDPAYFKIEYMPGNLCNYKCNYCFPGSNEGDMKWPDVEIVKKNLGHLLNYYSQQGKTRGHIYFVGGEVTLWKDLENLCSYIKENFNTTIELSTNGTRKIDWWDRNAKNFDHVNVSVHREYCDIDHIIEVCDLLYEKGLLVGADVLFDPLTFDQCVSFVERLKTSKHEWPIIAKVVHFNGVHRYNEEQLSYLKDNIKRYPPMDWFKEKSVRPRREIKITQDTGEVVTVRDVTWLVKNKLNYFSGWSCNVGIDLIKIFPDGRITSNCNQILYGNDFDFNLYQEDFAEKFKPELKPVICSKFICVCSEEMSCDKKKN